MKLKLLVGAFVAILGAFAGFVAAVMISEYYYANYDPPEPGSQGGQAQAGITFYFWCPIGTFVGWYLCVRIVRALWIRKDDDV